MQLQLQLQLQLPLHYTTLQLPLHYTTLRYSTLHYTNCTALHFNYNYNTLHYTTLDYTTLSTLHSRTLHDITPHYATPNTPHHDYNCNCTCNYTNYTTLHYTTRHNNYSTTTLHYAASCSCSYNYNDNCAAPHYIQQLWQGDRCLRSHSKKTQLQPPVGPSVASLCHPWFTTTKLSYRVSCFWNFRHRLVRYYWYNYRILQYITCNDFARYSIANPGPWKHVVSAASREPVACYFTRWIYVNIGIVLGVYNIVDLIGRK